MLVLSHVPIFLRATVLILCQTTHRSANALPILAGHFRRQHCTTPHLSLALHTSAKLCRFVTSQAFSSHIHGIALLRYSIACHFCTYPWLFRSTHSIAITVPCVALPLRIGSPLRFALPLRRSASLNLSVALHNFAHHTYLRLTKPWLRSTYLLRRIATYFLAIPLLFISDRFGAIPLLVVAGLASAFALLDCSMRCHCSHSLSHSLPLRLETLQCLRSAIAYLNYSSAHLATLCRRSGISPCTRYSCRRSRRPLHPVLPRQSGHSLNFSTDRSHGRHRSSASQQPIPSAPV